MAVLNAQQRKASETLPGGRFPMPDKNHARNALARLNQAKGLSQEQKNKVRRRARKILYGDGAIKEAKKQRESGHVYNTQKNSPGGVLT